MPMLMPTPEELAHIPGHKRDKIHRAVLRILTEVDDVVDSAIAAAERERTFGDRVRAEATALELLEPRDDVDTIVERRIAVLHNCGNRVRNHGFLEAATAIDVVTDVRAVRPASICTHHQDPTEETP